MQKAALFIFAVALLFGRSSALLTHAQAMAQLSPKGITVSSSGGCSDRNVPTCTSLDQVRESTISQIIILKDASKCTINITGGTEVGHAGGTYSHWNGYKLDTSLNSCLENYIKSSFTYKGLRPGDNAPLYESAAGNIYALEGNHWDILYY